MNFIFHSKFLNRILPVFLIIFLTGFFYNYCNNHLLTAEVDAAEEELPVYASTAGSSAFSTGETYKIDHQGNIVWVNDDSPGSYSFKYDVKINDQEEIYVGDGAWTGAANAVMKLNSAGSLESLFEDPGGTVESVAVDLSGNVYAGSYDHNVYKFNAETDLIWVYEGHIDEVYSIEVDLNEYVYSASHDNQVHKINSTGENVWVYSQHSDDLRAVTVDQQGNVFSGGFDSELHRINPDGTNSWIVTPKEDGVIYGIAVDRDYVYVTISDTHGGDRGIPPEFRKLDKETGETIWINNDHDDMIYSIAVDKNGYIYTGSNDDTVRKTDPDGVNVWTTTQLEGNVYGVAVAPGRYGAGFWTEVISPTVATNAATAVDSSQATLQGDLTDLGGADSVDVHFRWGTDPNLETYSTTINQELTTTGTFSHTLSGLDPDTTYYFQAIATNTAGTDYGDILSFTTDESISVPTVETTSYQLLEGSKVRFIGKVIDSDGSQVEEVGFEWGVIEQGYDDQQTIPGVEGEFFHEENLNLSTTYYFRAMARNEIGWGYGEEKSFTTDDPVGAEIVVKMGEKMQIIEIGKGGVIVVE